MNTHRAYQVRARRSTSIYLVVVVVVILAVLGVLVAGAVADVAAEISPALEGRSVR